MPRRPSLYARPARAPRAALGLLALLCGACKPFEELADHPCPPGGTTATYATFGAPFMDAYCQRCHGSQALDREGAPGEFIFDSAADVRRHRARIFVRSAAGNVTMPPGPTDPPRDERDLLADWLACGAD